MGKRAELSRWCWWLELVCLMTVILVSGWLLPIQQISYSLGNGQHWQIRNNLAFIQAISDCSAWELDKPFHIICMALFKNPSPGYSRIYSWQRYMCDYIEDVSGAAPDSVRVHLGGLRSLCAGARALSATRWVLMALLSAASVTFCVCFVLHLRRTARQFKYEVIFKLGSVALLTGFLVAMNTSLFGFQISPRSSLPVMETNSMPMVVTPGVRTFKLLGLLLCTLSVALYTASVCTQAWYKWIEKNDTHVARSGIAADYARPLSADGSTYSFWALRERH